MSVEASSIDSLLSGKNDSFDPISSSSSETIDSKELVNVGDEVNEKIKEYYKLKQVYETKIQSQKSSIMKNDKLTLKDKQDKFRKLTANCVNCGRKVGTIFENGENRLTAICGDKTKPCNLDIKIHRGAYIPLEELMNVFQKGVNDLKEEIIAVKLDLLFGYEKEAQVLEKFKKLKDELSKDLEDVMEYKTQYIEKMYRLDNKTELDAKMRTFYNNVSAIKSTIEEFNETGKIQLIKDMIVVYDKEMLPLLDEIRNAKYKYINMEQTEGEIKLVRKIVTLHDMMYAMETPNIESFVLGKKEE
tara:strand:+ start:1981 stop:2886 length:906 start_codon:yes stop_codon:yes gene_type:complete